jgi:hypothetical protein
MTATNSFAAGTAGQLDLYYRYPTRVPPLAIINALIVGIGVGLVAAAAYAYAIAFIPIIYLSLILTGLFGAVLGFVPAYAMRRGKVTSVTAMVAVAMIVTAVCYCFHWFVWLFAMLHHEVPLTVLLTHPVDVIDLLKEVNAHGVWSLHKGDSPVSGIALDVVWLCEAGAIFCIAWLVASKQRGETPFCDSCGIWCPAGAKVRAMKAGDTADLRRRIEARDWSYLDTLGPMPEGANRWFSLFYHACPQCGQLHTLTARDTVVSHDKKGNAKTTSRIIVDKLLIDPAELEQIREQQAVPPKPPVIPEQSQENVAPETEVRKGDSPSGPKSDGFGLD